MSMKKAFTLIELLIVIAIIGILATLIFVNVNVARKKARDAKRMADLKNLQTAVELYAQDNPGSPTTGNVWITSSAQPANYIPGLSPTYIGTLPKDPLQGSAGYYYAYRSDGSNYKIRACLVESTTGFDNNNAFWDPAMNTCFMVTSSLAVTSAW